MVFVVPSDHEPYGSAGREMQSGDNLVDDKRATYLCAPNRTAGDTLKVE
jgi:hypothetical protein